MCHLHTKLAWRTAEECQAWANATGHGSPAVLTRAFALFVAHARRKLRLRFSTFAAHVSSHVATPDETQRAFTRLVTPELSAFAATAAHARAQRARLRKHIQSHTRALGLYRALGL